MNYHYIDYMIKERHRDEREACERKRLLNGADKNRTGLIRIIRKGIVDAVHHQIKQRFDRDRYLRPRFSVVRGFVRNREEAR